MSDSPRLICIATLLAQTACLSPESSFGRHCTSSDECASAEVCVAERCVPAREAGDVGESCAAPLALTQEAPGVLPAMGAAAFGGAQFDVESNCGGGADLVFSFSIEDPTGLRIAVDSDDGATVAVSLHRLADGACEVELSDSCAAGDELVVASVAEGSWAVIVHGNPAARDVVRVTVERLDCPLGYLPYGDHCAGFRTVAANSIPRADAKLTTVADGRAILTGGREADLVPADSAEVFDPTSETWTYVPFRMRRKTHSPVRVGDDFLVIGGGKDPEILLRTSGGDDEVSAVGFGSSVGFDRQLSETSLETAAGLPSGNVVVIFDNATFLMRIVEPPIRCQSDYGCVSLYGSICVTRNDNLGNPLPDGFCLCASGPCLGPPELQEISGVTGTPPLGAATADRPLVATTRGEGEIVLLHNGDAVFELDVAAQFWREIPVAARDGVALDAANNGAVATGGREDGRASSRVEWIDTATRRKVDLPALRDARVGHAHAVLADGRVLLVGGAGNGSSLDTAELIDLTGAPTPLLPRLPAPLSRATAATLPDGRVLIVGAAGNDGLARTALLFEIVAPDYVPPELDQGAICGAIAPVELVVDHGGDEPPPVRETTVGERDHFRDPSCGSVDDTTGPERLFHFRIDRDAAFFAKTDRSYASLALWRGTCEDQAPLGCVGTQADLSQLEAPTLTAGDYTLVVEAHQSYFEPTGVAFDVTAWIDDPYPCAAGTEDPADDTMEGARRLDVPLPSDDPSVAANEQASGILCRGDVDHLIVDLWSEQSQLTLSSVASNRTTLARAVIDDDASLAADQPVYSFGPPMPFGRGTAEPGIYLLRLGIGDEDPLIHRWAVDHYPWHCVPDELDSLAPVLDDGQNPVRRTRLETGEVVTRCLPSPSDVDVAVFPVPADEDSAVALDLADWTRMQVYALTAPDAPLGAPIGAEVLDRGRAGIPAGVSPWAAVVVQTEAPIGELFSLTLSRAGAGDLCQNALALPDSGTFAYDSDNYANDLDAEELGDCTSYEETGSDVVGGLTLGDGDRLQASLDPGGANDDVSLYLLTTCERVMTACVAGADEGASAASEHIDYLHIGPEAPFFLVADSYYPDAYSAILSWSVTRAVP